jgi:hypothetical protein
MARSGYKDKDGGVLFSFSGVWISWLHTILAYCTPSLVRPSPSPSPSLSVSPSELELPLFQFGGWTTG